MHTVFIGLMMEHARVEIDTDVLLKNVGKPELVAFNYFCSRYERSEMFICIDLLCAIILLETGFSGIFREWPPKQHLPLPMPLS